MTNTARLYALAAALAAFFVLWAVIAAKPWQPATSDPRLAALDQRAQLLRRQTVLVRQIARRRAAAAAGAARAVPSAAPPVRVVSLPPIVVTRTS